MDFGLIIALPDANQTRMGILTLQVWEIFAMRVFTTKKQDPQALPFWPTTSGRCKAGRHCIQCRPNRDPTIRAERYSLPEDLSGPE